MNDNSAQPAATRPRIQAPASAVAATSGAAFDEAIALTRRLKLPHIRRAMAEIIPTAKAQRWDPAEIVRALLAEEAAGRDAANLRTRRTRAAFPTGKTFHIWNEEASSIPIPTQSALRTLEWVGRRENLCVVGPSGTGKSHFSEALGQSAVDAGMTVAWFTIEDLGALIRRHRVDDSVSKAITRITRTDLIVVDDIGLLPVSPDAAEGFYRLVDAAYERRSLAVSSNLHPSGFDEIMPKTLATATVDRLLHHAHVVVTQGDSHRLAEATTGRGVVPLG
ncbi:IS21-like element helper ATPase IstB [Embleya sp. NPDC059237]|uniref:IS21-like element helper ATPase IstB n=1 Tax=Embleya sp. NPDC059237 TaxID=3346784 RepID=UPI00368B39BE